MTAAAIAATVTTAHCEESAARTGIFILVDVSETWHGPSLVSNNERVLARTIDSVMALVGRVETPIAISVGTIGQDSLMQKPVCEAAYRRTLISLSSTPGTFTQKEPLRNHLDLCARAVLTRPIAKWTDISGAFDAVARAADSASYSQKFVFVLSDLKEERPRGQGSAAIRMNGFNAALIYRILPEDSANPAGLNSRLASWQQKLRSYGVARTVVALDSAQFSRELPAKLLGEQQ